MTYQERMSSINPKMTCMYLNNLIIPILTDSTFPRLHILNNPNPICILIIQIIDTPILIEVHNTVVI